MLFSQTSRVPCFCGAIAQFLCDCTATFSVCVSCGLSGPILCDIAILSLRYPISRDTFKGRLALPKMVRYPPLVLSFTQAHRCDTPFCNLSRDNCAIPHKNKHERVFAILSLQVLRYMKKYRCWASKHLAKNSVSVLHLVSQKKIFRN